MAAAPVGGARVLPPSQPQPPRLCLSQARSQPAAVTEPEKAKECDAEISIRSVGRPVSSDC